MEEGTTANTAQEGEATMGDLLCALGVITVLVWIASWLLYNLPRWMGLE